MKHQGYAHYKPSGSEWLGNVPGHWQLTPLFTVLKEVAQRNTKLQEHNLLSLSYGRIIRKDIDSPEGLLPESFDTYQIVQNGDIILRLTDLQNDKRSLRVGLVRERGIITAAYVNLRASGNYDPRFLFYQLHAADIQKIFYNFGGGVRQSMKYDDLRRLPLAIPPVTEQRLIANFLDRETSALDTLIAKIRRFISICTERDNSIRVEAALRGLDETAPLRESGYPWIGKVPRHWESIAMKFICEIKYGISLELDRRLSEGVRTISLPNVSLDGALNVDEVPFIPREMVSPEDILRKGDLLFNWRNGSPEHVGKTALFDVDGEFTHVSFLLRLRVRPSKANPQYVRQLLFALRAQGLFSASKNQVNRTYNQTELGNLVVPVPPLPEQALIVKHIEFRTSGTKQLQQLAKQQVQQLSEYRSALISAAVTGQIDVCNYGRQELVATCL